MPKNLTASDILQEVEGLLQPHVEEDALAGEVSEVGGDPRPPGNRAMPTLTLMGAGMEMILTTVMLIMHGIQMSGAGVLKLLDGAGVEGCQPGLSPLPPPLPLPLHARLPPLRPLEAGRLSRVREGVVGEGGRRREEEEEAAATTTTTMTMMTAVKKSARRSEALDRLHPSPEDDDC